MEFAIQNSKMRLKMFYQECFMILLKQVTKVLDSDGVDHSKTKIGCSLFEFDYQKMNNFEFV